MPLDNLGYLYPECNPATFKSVLRDSPESEIFIFGHTHVPMHIYLPGKNRHIFNPGSVSSNRGDTETQTCAILNLDNYNYEVLDIQTGQPVSFIQRAIT